MVGFVSVHLVADSTVTPAPQVAPEPAVKEEPRPTINEAKRCIQFKRSGDCEFYESTFGSKGVTCTEECLQLKFSGCALKNTCQFNEKSGCFTKKICVKHNSLYDCQHWDTEMICN